MRTIFAAARQLCASPLLLAIFFLLVMAPTRSFSDEFDDFPWLVKVQSDYADPLSPARQTTFTGYGFVVEAFQKSYVITASHLSQGGMSEDHPNLTLQRFNETRHQFQDLHWQKRMAKNKQDVEVIELVPGDYDALAQWEPSQRSPRGQWKLKEKWRRLFEEEKSNLAPRGFTAIGLRSFLPESLRLSQPYKSPLEGLTKQQARERLQASDSFFEESLIKNGFDVTDAELVAPSAIHSGMSGLPLIHLEDDLNSGQTNSLVIAGLVASTSRGFDNSWFALSEFTLMTLTHLRQAGNELKPTAPVADASFLDGNTFWNCRNGFLFRDGLTQVFYDRQNRPHQFSFAEANLSRREPTGNGTRVDAGNSKGLHASLDLLPGIVFWDRALPKPTSLAAIAFEVERGDKQKVLIPGDMSSLVWMLGQLQEGKISPEDILVIRRGDHLGQHMWKQAQQLLGVPKNQTLSGFLDFDQMLPLKVSPKSQIKFLLTLKGDQLEITLDAGFDRWQFQLDADGALSSEAGRFASEIVVRSEKLKIKSRIDLSSLLMLSPSFYNFAFESMPHDFQKRAPNPQVHAFLRVGDTEYLMWK